MTFKNLRELGRCKDLRTSLYWLLRNNSDDDDGVPGELAHLRSFDPTINSIPILQLEKLRYRELLVTGHVCTARKG